MLSTVLLNFCLLFAGASGSDCSQPAAERNALIGEADQKQFILRCTTFIGLTYTHDNVVRDRMTPIVIEGDVFSRAKLVRALRSMSALKRSIYPLGLANVIIQLDRSEALVDLTICFRQRPRRVN
jgi:hypothetical protein